MMGCIFQIHKIENALSVMNPVRHVPDPMKLAFLVLKALKESTINVNPDVKQSNIANKMGGKIGLIKKSLKYQPV